MVKIRVVVGLPFHLLVPPEKNAIKEISCKRRKSSEATMRPAKRICHLGLPKLRKKVIPRGVKLKLIFTDVRVKHVKNVSR